MDDPQRLGKCPKNQTFDAPEPRSFMCGLRACCPRSSGSRTCSHGIAPEAWTSTSRTSGAGRARFGSRRDLPDVPERQRSCPCRVNVRRSAHRLCPGSDRVKCLEVEGRPGFDRGQGLLALDAQHGLHEFCVEHGALGFDDVGQAGAAGSKIGCDRTRRRARGRKRGLVRASCLVRSAGKAPCDLTPSWGARLQDSWSETDRRIILMACR